MRKRLYLMALCSVASMAQVSGPLVDGAPLRAVSEPLTMIAARGMTNAFSVREFRVSRNHMRQKNVSASPSAASLVAPSVATTTSFEQTATFQALNATMGANFEALGVGTPGFSITGAPPDTTLAVSPTQIVQWVNTQLAVYDKTGTPLLPSPGFVNGNALWQAMPSNSLCRQFNQGDPIVQYDRIAGRWIFSQFAFNDAFTSNAQCFAVSTSSNALGTYNVYEFSFGGELPDYGKLGVWPDAYYMSYNMFNVPADSFTGARACAYDKVAMMAGSAASQICFNTVNDFAYLPADLDGTATPPAGTANYFVSWNFYNTTAPYTTQIRRFKPNFINPGLSTFNDGFGGATFSSVNIVMDAATKAACNDSGGTCVPQLGTTNTLDTLADRQMYRLVYRNFGSYDALLYTQSVDMTAGAQAQLRWWEIRNPGANPPVVYQNSTYRPTADFRWMGSAAFDKLGNIGIGYSTSSSTTRPGIRVSGRLRNDPKNYLRAETTIITGGGSQTGSLSRWGDYSTMQIDPADDCTFWFTTQYLGTTGSFNWQTRIAAFRFPNCQ